MTDYMTFDANGRHTGIWLDAPRRPVPTAVPVSRSEIDDYHANWPFRRWDGARMVESEAPASPERPLTERDYSREIQAHLDATAKQRQYDSIQTAVGYRDSANPRWAAEAQALFAWRDAVWIYAFAELDKVQNGLRPAPTVSEFLAEMPAMVWPV